ncbi:piggyBac transposable element-derived protein 4-like [Dicentrarchus labrax]|uniref:piggyBac transposable element-derived protein 4-like n=1 Tax=Dicentrarchus labrax TaxID=13489 RepID=UPI0021F54BEF|nr:piggyBac transposable element-derived protein 4-like [Dicentrarchus labrax]
MRVHVTATPTPHFLLTGGIRYCTRTVPHPRYEDGGPSTRRPTRRGRGRRSQMRSRSPQARPLHRLEPWGSGSDPDAAPQMSRFMPRRTPGAQVDTHAACTPLDLFQLYFSPTTVRTLCTNTNKRAAKSKEMGKKYKWADVEVEELYKFLWLLTYTSLVPLPSITDYWKQNTITCRAVSSYSDGEGPFQGSALEHPPQ